MASRFGRIVSSGTPQAAYNQINQNFAKLDAEVQTKQFKDNSGNSMLIGNLSDDQFGLKMLDKNGSGLVIGYYRANRFGTLYYQSGVPVGLDGMAPDDGRIGSWRAKPGENVLTLLGG